LPNMGDLDDALVRPGRCFGRVLTRRLSQPEALKLMTVLEEPAENCCNTNKQRITEGVGASYSLAELYRESGDLHGDKHSTGSIAKPRASV
jgi:hypothetical protein